MGAPVATPPDQVREQSRTIIQSATAAAHPTGATSHSCSSGATRARHSQHSVFSVIRIPSFFFRLIYVIFCPPLTTAVPPAIPPSLPVPARDSSRSTSLVPRLQPANPPVAPVSPNPLQHPPQLPDPSLPGTSLLSIPAPL